MSKNTFNGYISMKEIKRRHIRPSIITSMVHDGLVEKIKPGLYRSKDIAHNQDIPLGFIDIAQALPDSVICMISALSYYNLTTTIPQAIHVAIPHSMKPPKIIYPIVQFHYFRKTSFSLGVETITTQYGPVNIYSREKTICDIFKARNTYGEDLAIEALKAYMNSPTRAINELYSIAAKMNIETVILPYIKAIIG